jgi:coproporphyrinogen III oxidase-like Fe-S oxidoreductase
VPGEESRHNLGYWRGLHYLGLGTGAYGCVPTGAAAVRYRNEVQPEKYMYVTQKHAGQEMLDALTVLQETLDAPTRLRERIMLGLRLAEGIDIDAAATALGCVGMSPARERELDKLLARGRVVRSGSHVRMSAAAWLFADDSAARLF